MKMGRINVPVSIIIMTDKQHEELMEAHAPLIAMLKAIITQLEAKKDEPQRKTTTTTQQPKTVESTSHEKTSEKVDPKKIVKWLGDLLAEAAANVTGATDIEEKNRIMLEDFQKQLENAEKEERLTVKEEIAKFIQRQTEILTQQKNATTIREPEKLSMFNRYVQELYEAIDRASNKAK